VVCTPAWILEALYPIFDDLKDAYIENSRWQPGDFDTSLTGHPLMCAILNTCGYPCPDSCVLETSCDSVVSAYNTVLSFLDYLENNEEQAMDSNELSVIITSIELGTSYTWDQLQAMYEFCNGNPEPLLCNRPLMPPLNPAIEDSCFEIMQEYAYQDAAWAYQNYMQNVHEDFVNAYIEKCLGAYRFEQFDYIHPNGEYHFTLYYYDQAGNLVKTIPPAGYDTTGQANHKLATVYRYNTLNQVIEQRTPDARYLSFLVRPYW
jgi:hypothetical protein